MQGWGGDAACADIVEVHLLFDLVTCKDDAAGELLNLMYVGMVHIHHTQCRADAMHSSIVLGLRRMCRTGMVEVHLLFDRVTSREHAAGELLGALHIEHVLIQECTTPGRVGRVEYISGAEKECDTRPRHDIIGTSPQQLTPQASAQNLCIPTLPRMWPACGAAGGQSFP